MRRRDQTSKTGPEAYIWRGDQTHGIVILLATTRPYNTLPDMFNLVSRSNCVTLTESANQAGIIAFEEMLPYLQQVFSMSLSTSSKPFISCQLCGPTLSSGSLIYIYIYSLSLHNGLQCHDTQRFYSQPSFIFTDTAARTAMGPARLSDSTWFAVHASNSVLSASLVANTARATQPRAKAARNQWTRNKIYNDIWSGKHVISHVFYLHSYYCQRTIIICTYYHTLSTWSHPSHPPSVVCAYYHTPSNRCSDYYHMTVLIVLVLVLV